MGSEAGGESSRDGRQCRVMEAIRRTQLLRGQLARLAMRIERCDLTFGSGDDGLVVVVLDGHSQRRCRWSRGTIGDPFFEHVAYGCCIGRDGGHASISRW